MCTERGKGQDVPHRGAEWQMREWRQPDGLLCWYQTGNWNNYCEILAHHTFPGVLTLVTMNP